MSQTTVLPVIPPNTALRLSDQLIDALRQRVESRYYDQIHVIEVIARAILHSRGIYP